MRINLIAICTLFFVLAIGCRRSTQDDLNAHGESVDEHGLIKKNILAARTKRSHLFAQSRMGGEGSRYLDSFIAAFNAFGRKDDARDSSRTLLSEDNVLLLDKAYQVQLEIQTRDPSAASGLLYTEARGIPEVVAVCAGTSCREEDVCCSGVLLSADLVLSARHCFQDCAGSILTNDKTSAMSVKVVREKTALCTPIFDPDSLLHDLMIMKLEKKVTVPKLREFPEVAAVADFSVDTSLTVAGFGKFGRGCTAGSGVPTEIWMGIPREHNCGEGEDDFYCDSKYQLIAAGENESGSGVCYGDSGGPAFIAGGSKRLLAGLISGFGRANRDRNELLRDRVLLVQLDQYVSWVKAVTKGTGDTSSLKCPPVAPLSTASLSVGGPHVLGDLLSSRWLREVPAIRRGAR